MELPPLLSRDSLEDSVGLLDPNRKFHESPDLEMPRHPEEDDEIEDEDVSRLPEHVNDLLFQPFLARMLLLAHHEPLVDILLRLRTTDNILSATRKRRVYEWLGVMPFYVFAISQ